MTGRGKSKGKKRAITPEEEGGDDPSGAGPVLPTIQQRRMRGPIANRVQTARAAITFTLANPDSEEAWGCMADVLSAIMDFVGDNYPQHVAELERGLKSAQWKIVGGDWVRTKKKVTARALDTMMAMVETLIGIYAAPVPAPAPAQVPAPVPVPVPAPAPVPVPEDQDLTQDALRAADGGPLGGIFGRQVAPPLAPRPAGMPAVADLRADQLRLEAARLLREGLPVDHLHLAPAPGVYGQNMNGYPAQEDNPIAGPLHAGALRLEIGAGGVLAIRQGVGAILSMQALDESWERDIERAEGANDVNLNVLIRYYSYLRKLVFRKVDWRDVLVVDREIRGGWKTNGVSFTKLTVDVALALHLVINPRVVPVPPQPLAGGGGNGGRNGGRGGRGGRGGDGGRAGGRGRQAGVLRACWGFNSAAGCVRENCHFTHVCSECYSDEHSAPNCRQVVVYD
jgi:hypothetical protein